MGRIAGTSPPPLVPHYDARLRFYREERSPVYSLVNSRRIGRTLNKQNMGKKKKKIGKEKARRGSRYKKMHSRSERRKGRRFFFVCFFLSDAFVLSVCLLLFVFVLRRIVRSFLRSFVFACFVCGLFCFSVCMLFKALDVSVPFRACERMCVAVGVGVGVGVAAAVSQGR